MIAIFQVGGPIYSVAESLSAAAAEAADWIEDMPAPVPYHGAPAEPQNVPNRHGRYGTENGLIAYAPCSNPLAERFQSDGGDIRYQFDGEQLDVDDE